MVIGLGNPEPSYRRHRHNIGFMIVEHLAQRAELSWRNSSRCSAVVAIGTIGRQPTIVVKPQTFMNLSGEAVSALAHFYRVPTERMAVIHDDVDLDFGRLKIKRGGGDGGHNGLRSLTELLGEPDYHRLRFGVGRPEHGDLADYVLSDFSADEADRLPEVIARGAEATQVLIGRGLKAAMNRFNRKEKQENNTSDETSDAPATPADDETISTPATAKEV